MTYIVIELQTNIDGTVGNIVTAYTDRNQAEQQYHYILAAAAVSNLPVHAAVMLTSEGKTVMYQCYKHAVTYVPPVEEPEPTETEPEDV